jgi:hypothetical protein
MVQVRGVTYRVERLKPHYYAVVRLLDDAALGTFWTLPGLRLNPEGCDVDLFAEIAKTALRFARTSGSMTAVAPPRASERRVPSEIPPSGLQLNPS